LKVFSTLLQILKFNLNLTGDSKNLKIWIHFTKFKTKKSL
jgi:hypothetical protein